MSLLIALLQALVLFAVAPLLSGIVRVARARLHNRRGPGVLQEYRDILKLLGRQSVGPDASGWVFRLTPYVMVGVMLTIATALPVVTVDSPLPVLGDLITLISPVRHRPFLLCHFRSGHRQPVYRAGQQSRSDARRAGGADPAVGPVGGGAGRRLDPYQRHHRYPLPPPAARSIPLILALCACAFATFIEMGKLPFDLAEAEQELRKGRCRNTAAAALAS